MKTPLTATLVFLISLFVLGREASASTFIGNGGNAGDVEWLVTLRQLNETLNFFEASLPDDDSKVCTCNDTFSNHSTCEALKSLTTEQTEMCGKVLRGQLSTLRDLVSLSHQVHVEWTRDDIEVKDGARLRAADAVTDRSQNRITLNPERFMAMRPFERIFLISHELFHLTDYEQKPMVDEGPIGPFTGKDGSRELINSMAAAITVRADQAMVMDRYYGTLKRPQGWKENWVDLKIGSSDSGDNSTFAMPDYKSFEARFRHYFRANTAFGLTAGVRTLKGEKKILSRIDAEENVESLSLGVSYRYFPIDDPLSYFGQSHLVLAATLDSIRGRYSLSDPSNPKDSVGKNRTAVSAALDYELPVTYGLWLSLSVAYQSLPGSYDFAGVEIKNKDHALSTSIGASYAF